MIIAAGIVQIKKVARMIPTIRVTPASFFSAQRRIRVQVDL
jgi:hypothetical protein